MIEQHIEEPQYRSLPISIWTDHDGYAFTRIKCEFMIESIKETMHRNFRNFHSCLLTVICVAYAD